MDFGNSCRGDISRRLDITCHAYIATLCIQFLVFNRSPIAAAIRQCPRAQGEFVCFRRLHQMCKRQSCTFFYHLRNRHLRNPSFAVFIAHPEQPSKEPVCIPVSPIAQTGSSLPCSTLRLAVPTPLTPRSWFFPNHGFRASPMMLLSTK